MVDSDLVQSFNALKVSYRNAIDEIYEARKYIAKAISKLDDVEKELKKGWGIKND